MGGVFKGGGWVKTMGGGWAWRSGLDNGWRVGMMKWVDGFGCEGNVVMWGIVGKLSLRT